MRLYWCACIMAIFAFRSPVHAQVPGATVRYIKASNTPITGLIEPGESALVIESRKSPPLEAQPPLGISRIDWLFQTTDVSLVVVIDSIKSRLTRNGDWITSIVQATVIEVFKTPDSFVMKIGDSFSFEADGGQALIDGALVTAVVPWAKPIEASRRYFIFGAVNRNSKALMVGPGGLYEIADGSGKLRRLANPRRTDQIEQASEWDLSARLRELGAR